MVTIGNDIIDLALLAQHQRSGQPRFWQRILCPAEQEWLKEASEPAVDIWKLWALKESAYKCYFQLTGRRHFAPKKFSCHWISVCRAEITTPDGVCYARIEHTTDYVHALCSNNERYLEQAGFRIFLLQSQSAREQSVRLRHLARQWIAKNSNRSEKDLQWEESEGYPRLYHGQDPLTMAISLSHHGKWAAAAMAPHTGIGY